MLQLGADAVPICINRHFGKQEPYMNWHFRTRATVNLPTRIHLNYLSSGTIYLDLYLLDQSKTSCHTLFCVNLKTNKHDFLKIMF